MNFVVVKNIVQGIERTKEFLYEEVDRRTVLFLSGGRTPKALYETLASEKILAPAAVGLIDERYGDPMHENSNELMIQRSGFLPYVKQQNIPFFSMLSSVMPAKAGIYSSTSPWEKLDPGLESGMTSLDGLVEHYDQAVRDLFFKFPKSIGIIGIGDDGHIASIFPNRKDFVDPLFHESKKYDYVGGVDDPGKYGKRISLTFAGLALMDFYVVFVFGKEKKKALTKALTPGPVEEIPARFFLRPGISEKTLFITDQKI